MNARKRRRKNRIVIIKLFFWLILFLISICLIKKGFAKYKSTATSNTSVDFAYYLLKEESISHDLKLDSILPRAETYRYTFSISNFDGEDRTETALEYIIKLKTTTNLPLIYKVYKGDGVTDIITNTNVQADDDGTYFKYMTVQKDTIGFRQNETNTYVLEIEFPEEYNYSEYEGIIEYIQIIVDAQQRIE